MDKKLTELARLIRYYILLSSTAAGSGHPTSSLSAVELMTTLLFGGFFKYDLKKPGYHNNDRLIFSKGHASPLFYGLWATAGALTEKELKTFRKITSVLEGHPGMRFKYTEAATGSLGQGLSIGLGMALNAKYLDKLPYTTYVLLGDSEMAEGSVWEAMELAAYYKLNNLVAIVDVNRLGQRGQTIHGYNLASYEQKARAFGWQTIVLKDGHDFSQIKKAYQKSQQSKNKPVMIIAKTVKGKGVSFLENKDNWHGVALKPEEFKKALSELGKINKKIRGVIKQPGQASVKTVKRQSVRLSFNPEPLATRKAFGQALVEIYPAYPNLVSLDAEVSNSTYSQIFKKAYPKRFFEMFVAEQNMVGTALGLALRGKLPFVSTFAAFLSRAADQIRMSQYSNANLKFVGSHAGVSIGADGASQMALEDISLFRSILNSTVLYPCDSVSAKKLVLEMAKRRGICYLRTTRSATPVVYSKNESFVIGGSKVLKSTGRDKITVVAAGITVFEALAAYEELKKDKINVRVIDLYSIKPLDQKTLFKAAKDTRAIITVEDHYSCGGLGEAVAAVLSGRARVEILAVGKIPRSGTPEQLRAMEGIDKNAIIRRVKKVLNK
jgi:transketolase